MNALDEFASARSLAQRLDRVATLFGPNVAQVYATSGTIGEEPRSTTYAQLAAATRQKAHALRSLGVRSDERGGDVICALLPLSQGSYSTLLAAMIAGTVAPVNYFLEADALIELARAAGASVLLTAGRYDDDPQCAAKIEKIRAALPALRHVVYDADTVPAGSLSLDAAAAQQAAQRWPEGCDERAPHRVVALFHTGGTTGRPKLVPHTQAMYLAMADSCARAMGTVSGEVMMAPLPLFHTSGALQAGTVPLLAGAQLVIPCSRGFRAPEFFKDYWRFVERHRVTIIAGVPTVLSAIAAMKPDADISSIRRVLVGGAPLSVHVIDTLKQMLGPHQLLEGWGMTETCGFSVLNPPGRAKPGAVGVPFPDVQIEIRKADASGEARWPCECNEIGELVVRGPIVITRYHDARPGAFTDDGWLRTGDRGRIDEDGFLWITGRVKDLIIRGGHNIEPGMIEEAAYQHPAVQLAAAVGQPDRHTGELPVLYVQLKPGAEASPEQIAEFAAPRIPERAAIPKAVFVLPQLPLSGPGKISKLTLRREAARSVFQADVDKVLNGTKVSVQIVEDPEFGEIAALRSVSGVPPDAAVHAVRDALAGYTWRHRWL